MAGATSGTTSRFTAGEISASRPNEARTTGSVAACAASDTPRLSASQRGSRPRASRSSRSVSGVAQAMSPAVASVDSWKPASHHERRLREQQQERRPAERRGCPPAPPGLAGQQDDAGHRPGAQDRRRGPGEHDVRDDRDGGHDRPSTTPEPPGHGPDGGRDDGDVPARDGDDVADAGRRERRRDVAVDAVAQADEDPGGQPGLGFGQDAGEQLAGIAAPALELRARVGRAGRATSIERRVERAPRAESLEIPPVRACPGRGRSDPRR